MWLPSYNPGQGICHKIEKSSKTGQVKKSLISTFAYFWAAIASTQKWDFPDISLFPKIQSLKSFGNSWDNSYTKFTVLDTMFRFTCD